MKSKTPDNAVFLRVMVAPDVAIGPGKANLLEGIKKTGSIAATGRQLGMSYKRAWYLVDALNGHFDTPLVSSSKGGRTGGGAKLTELGEDVLLLYREMQLSAEKAVTPALRKLRRRVPTDRAVGK